MRYPLVELLCGLLVLAVFHHNWPFIGFRTLAEVYFVLALVAITFIDIDHLFIPDELTLPGMVIGLAAAAVSPIPFLSGFWLQYKLVVWSRGLTGNLSGLRSDRVHPYRDPALDRGPVLRGLSGGRRNPNPRRTRTSRRAWGAVTAEFLGATGHHRPDRPGGAGGEAGSWSARLSRPPRFRPNSGACSWDRPCCPRLSARVWGMALGGGTVMVIFAAYLLYRGEEGMGLGDLTLLAMIGAFLGWRSIFLVVFTGSISAMLVYLVLAAKNRAFDMKEMLPFGPFLSFGALVYLFFGESILAWYLG